MSHDFDDDIDPNDPPRFPAGALAAGIIWIGFGGLGLLGIGVNLISFAVMAAQNAPPAGGPPVGPMACGFGCVGLIAAVFLYVGIQTVRGAARDTLGNAVGSIVLAVLAYGFAAMGVVMGVVGVGGPAGGGAPPNFVIAAGVMMAVVYGLAGTALLAAGIMALYARRGYQAWREANGRGRPRRRRRDEGDGDEPDDRGSEGRP